jgi:hypothetical protein
MLRHIVMIQFNENSKSSKIAFKLKSELLNLKNKIDVLLNMEVGINISKSVKAYDLVLIADFRNENDLNFYRNHPDHLKILEDIKQKSEKINVVDYFN